MKLLFHPVMKVLVLCAVVLAVACAPAREKDTGMPRPASEPPVRSEGAGSADSPSLENGARLARAISARDRGDYARAAALFGELARSHPENSLLQMELGWALAQTERIAPALVALERAAQLAPEDERSHYLHGWVLVSAKRYADAVVAYRRSLALDPDGGETHYELGRTLGLLAGDKEASDLLPDAISHVRRAIELRPTEAKYYDELGNLLGGSGQFEQSAAAMREAVRLEPANANLWHNLGNQEQNAGNYGAAVRAYERVLQLDPARADRPDFDQCLTAARADRGC